MAVITFTSDFGEEDHYVAAVKSAIRAINSGLQIHDITHRITPFDIAHAAYVLQHIYPVYPESTVHLIAIDPVQKASSTLVAVKLNNHFFVSHDSGIFSLLSANKPAAAVELLNPSNSSFPARDVMAKACAQLASGTDIQQLGRYRDQINIAIGRQLKITKKEIAGNVVRVDHYGNLITNIHRTNVEQIMNLLGEKASFTVRVGREFVPRVHSNYSDVEDGEIFVLFNTYGYLEIGINKGAADKLLGLRHDTPIVIEFNQ
jgi:S-adenosyl-L-methionine hydrolase (adenosine-forming)